MIQITWKTRYKCCGCIACSNICPRGCIEMKPDAERFLYCVADAADCNECGLCEKACLVLSRVPLHGSPSSVIMRTTDPDVRMKITSRGAVTPLAGSVLARGGVLTWTVLW